MLDETKVVAIIDVETTGTLTNFDQIIEFAVQKGLHPDGFKKSWRFKPSIPIPPEATKVHGITDEDIAHCPPFSSGIDMIRRIFERTDIIVGYNIRFDLEMLQAEFHRASAPALVLSDKCIIDPYELWSRNEPRKLVDAVKRFVGREHINAHSAISDVQATGEVLLGMIKAFDLYTCRWEDLCDPEKRLWIGGTYHFKWRDDLVVFGFGKYKGKDLLTSVKGDLNYVNWICKNESFPVHVKKIVSAASEMEREAFLNFIKSHYGGEHF